jgi:hypothetical protein
MTSGAGFRRKMLSRRGKKNASRRIAARGAVIVIDVSPS